MDEGTVDLHEFRSKLGDDLHAGMTGAGVVDGDAVAGRAQLRRDVLQA
jgi:hypothetical protein